MKAQQRQGMSPPKINGNRSEWITSAMIECVVGHPHDEMNISVSEDGPIKETQLREVLGKGIYIKQVCLCPAKSPFIQSWVVFYQIEQGKMRPDIAIISHHPITGIKTYKTTSN